jgi:hypothetical protein
LDGSKIEQFGGMTKQEWAAYQRKYYLRHHDKLRARRKERWRNASTDDRLKRKRAEREFRLKTQYGLSVERFNAILDSQGGRCANSGCRKILDLDNKNSAIDHCHKAGHVRGILCQNCNSAIGYLNNSHRRAAGLVKYLSREIIFNGE